MQIVSQSEYGMRTDFIFVEPVLRLGLFLELR